MEYVAVSNNYLEYSLDDNHAVLFTDFILPKYQQSPSMPFMLQYP